MCRVLSIDYSVPYLVKRHATLRQAEIPVESASSLREAMALMRLGEFDVAVLGHGIPETERNLEGEQHLVPTIKALTAPATLKRAAGF